MKNKREILLRLAAKHFFRKVRSRLKRRLSNGGKISKTKRRKYHISSKIRYADIKASKQGRLERFGIKIPKSFCFIKDPIGTNKFFERLRKEFQKRKPRDIFIDHDSTEEIGLAASFLFDQIVKEEIEYWKTHKIRIRLAGVVSKSKQVNNFLLSFGILNELGISHKNFGHEQVDADYAEKYYTFNMKGSKIKRELSALASVGIVNYFNTCLEYNGFKITDTARLSLVERMGEIICNAEEHCGNDKGEWFTLGCYNKEMHNCSFAIINYGKTIYENLSDEESTASHVIEDIQKIIDSHRPFWQKLHGLILSKEHEEPTWNIMALQDGISSKRTETGRGFSRGQGIMDVLTFIEAIKAGNKGAEISLLSGHSAVKIDYSYPIIRKEVGPTKETRRFITFNKENDLKMPPDSNKVIFLDKKFQGAIFTGSFILDKKYLEERLKQKDGKGN
ncbi:MAG: hypothetical protein PHW54_05050 [Candidatus Omnitrophica bacterium]|nr:hypothetical protein [Candidatus Omnitrophota bacterium]